jgi:transposase
MTYISGHDRSQILLLLEAVDDYVDPDNPVRFIDAFVDGLDLSAASFTRVERKATGRPGYAPADMLKLYIYGYLNRGAVEPSAGGRDPPQYRGDLAAAAPEAGL